MIADIFKGYNQLYDGPLTDKPAVAPFNTDGITPIDRKKDWNMWTWSRRNVVEISKEVPAQMAANKESS